MQHDSPSPVLEPLPKDSSVEPLHPQKLGRYENLELIGAGGMAEVYKAYDPSLKRYVALKLIKWEAPELISRFVQEARAQARVDHEHVCKIYEAVMDTPQTRPHIAMQYIAGKTLKEAARELTLEQKIRIMRDIAEAVHAAHKMGLIHRDIKPSNILVERNEEGQWKAYISDFGLAKEIQAEGMTVTGVLVGTFHYMAPEQARGEVRRLDRRTDVYALGATLYEVLTETTPFKDENPIGILQKILEEEPAPPRALDRRIPEDLETIALKALEKEPHQRYESARAMAEDLSRYLQGDPVLARRTSLPHRLLRKAKKHKAVVILASAAALAVAIMGIWIAQARWAATRQAQLAQTFGQEVERVEAILRQAKLLPLHDTRKERELVQQKIAWIQNEMKVLGKVSHGPGNYALGKGYFALGKLDRAQQFLEKAWNEQYYREPDVAYALGLTLAMRYQHELEDAVSVSGKEEQAKRKAQIERRYRDPAMVYLQKGSRVTTEAVEYVEAILAFLSKDYNKSIQKAKLASNKTPWRYEPDKLLGDVYAAMANEQRDIGKPDEARSFYEQAETAYQQAVKKAESDSSVHSGICSLASTAMWMHLYLSGEDPAPWYHKGIAACDAAVQIDPESDDAHARRMLVLIRYSQYQSDHGGDPEPYLQQAIESGVRATRINPQNAMTYGNLGLAYLFRGDDQVVHGVDAEATFLQSAAAFDRAIALHPSNANFHINRGNAYLGVYECRITRGKQSEKVLMETINSFRTAIDLNPARASSFANLGIAYWDLAEDQWHRGVDPSSSLQEAVKSLHQALKVNPKLLPASNNLGGTYVTEAEYILYSGKDPGVMVEKALQSVSYSLHIDPDNFYALHYKGRAYSVAAEYLIASGKSASEPLQKSIESLQKALEANPENAQALADLGYAHLLKGQAFVHAGRSPHQVLQLASSHLDRSLRIDNDDAWTFECLGKMKLFSAALLMRGGRSPEPELQSAREYYRGAIQLRSNSLIYQHGLGQVFYYQALSLMRRKKNIQPSIQEGLKLAESILKVNPNDAHALLLQGSLHLLLSKTAATRADKERYASKGNQSVELACKLNPLLRREPFSP